MDGTSLYSLVVIPARMASTRLPGKPLIDIGGEPMIVRVWRQAERAGLGPVLVAAAEEEIAAAVRQAGGKAVLTDAGLPSGSDRVAQALLKADPCALFGVVVNVQGDLPTLPPEYLRICANALVRTGADIATLAAPIRSQEELKNPNVVKVMAPLAWEEVALAEDFVRELPPGHQGPAFHHIGIYAYRREALLRFVQLPPSLNERRRRLEQLRAMDAGMNIAVARVSQAPLGVDTPAELEYVRRQVERQEGGASTT